MNLFELGGIRTIFRYLFWIPYETFVAYLFQSFMLSSNMVENFYITNLLRVLTI